ncbi:hypothetical protein H0H92_000840, partial [Tricholoma furcatifolium]
MARKGPKCWADDHQLDWLNSKFDLFLEHQKEKTLHAFWPLMENQWFQRFPEPMEGSQGTDESGHNPIQEKKKQLRQWFNNNSQKMRKQSTQNPALAFFDEDKPSKGKRTLHASEFWSKTNYKEKVEPLVKAELAASNVPANRSLPIIKRHIRAAFDAEPEASRQLVYAELEEAKVRTKAEAKAASERAVSRTPAQVAAHHAGLNKLGHNFSQAHAGYKDNFVGPYVAFVRSCYTQRDLDSQALTFQHQTPLTAVELMSKTPPPNTAADTSPEASAASFVLGLSAAAGPSTPDRDCDPNIDPILYTMPSQTPDTPAPIVQQPSTAIKPSGTSEAFPFGPVVCPDSSEFVFPNDMFLDIRPSNPPSPANPTSSSPELSSYLDFFN